MSRLLAWVLAGLVAGGGLALPARAADDSGERLTVADAYLQLHTGPGRGYPVAQVVARGEAVVLEMRRTDWFRLRTDKGLVGWVHRSQLATTLTAAGTPQRLRDLLLDDWLARRAEAGAAYGRFGGEPMVKLFAGWRTSDTLSLEGQIGQVQGRFSGTSFWQLGLTVEPWSDRRWSPFFGVGVGKLHNVPNASLVGALDTDAKLAQATLGLKFHWSERFVARLEGGLYSAFVSDQRSTEYRAVGAGLSFFF
jgi:hypothetical protein